jgi:hypothetical protein
MYRYNAITLKTIQKRLLFIMLDICPRALCSQARALKSFLPLSYIPSPQKRKVKSPVSQDSCTALAIIEFFLRSMFLYRLVTVHTSCFTLASLIYKITNCIVYMFQTVCWV